MTNGGSDLINMKDETKYEDANLATEEMKYEVKCLFCEKERTFFNRKRETQPYICSNCQNAFLTMKKFINALEDGGVLND